MSIQVAVFEDEVRRGKSWKKSIGRECSSAFSLREGKEQTSTPRYICLRINKEVLLNYFRFDLASRNAFYFSFFSV